MTSAIPANVKPGIYQGIPNEAYHAGPGAGRSGLWTLETQSPAHFKYPAPVEETAQSKAAKSFGTATHVAVLEPEDFEKKVIKGPADRRGNKWTDLEEASKINNTTLLTEKDYENCQALRDTVHADPFLNGIITGGPAMVEATGYFIDPVTGLLCRVRPDLYRKDIKIILDVKTTKNAKAEDFVKSVTNLGYHFQEAFYTDGWQALDMPVDGFVFMALEKKSPFAFSVYELPPAIVEEGRMMVRKALDKHHECLEKNMWPGYPTGVQSLEFKRWQYRYTEAPTEEDAAA